MSVPQYTVYPDPNLKTKSFFLAQININEHSVIQAGPTSELAENRAALKLLLLLMRSYDLCDEDFYDNDDNKMQKTKNQSIQINPRPKLIPWEISCRICITQMHATKECRRRNILKVVKSTHFPPPLPPRNSSTFSRLFSPFLQKTPRPKSNHIKTSYFIQY